MPAGVKQKSRGGRTHKMDATYIAQIVFDDVPYYLL
jgi:hypothetical protein